MLKFKNIRLTKGIITAEYEPEDSREVGKIAVDVDSGKVLEQHLTESDKPFPMYFDKALEWLQENRKISNIPKDKTIMWY